MFRNSWGELREDKVHIKKKNGIATGDLKRKVFLENKKCEGNKNEGCIDVTFTVISLMCHSQHQYTPTCDSKVQGVSSSRHQ